MLLTGKLKVYFNLLLFMVRDNFILFYFILEHIS
jgi:hypothetical protein